MDRNDVNSPATAVQWMIEEHPDLFKEGYVVEATVEVVVGDNLFRLEAYHNVHANTRTYDTYAYRKEKGKWEPFTIGYCDRDSAAEALLQAMGFLWDAFRPKGESSDQ